MLRPRIIPCLLIQNGGLVKTVKFASPKYVGDPINAVKIFNEKEADELMVVDIDATVKKAEPDYKMISNLASECRMPLCYGGGIKDSKQAKKIINLGVEKISLSSAAIENSKLISQIADEIGCQSIVVVLDVKKTLFNKDYEIYINNGKTKTKHKLFELAPELIKYGVGELVINSIDLDGTMKGYDLELAKKIKQIVNIPVTFLGGAGSLIDIEILIKDCGVVGASAGSLFVFKGIYKAVLINYPSAIQRDEIFKNSINTH